MCPISPSPSLLCSVDLHVLHSQRIQVQLVLNSIGFQVLQQFQQELDRFLWPPTLCGLEFSGLRSTRDVAGVLCVGDATLVCQNLVEVGADFGDSLAFHHFGGFAGVFERDLYVFGLCFGAFL